jgi:hypothetical protein
MKRILFFLALLYLENTLHAQYIYTIKADSVKITNSCDTAELIIENHTQTVPGFLFNKGRGRTEFRRVLQNLTDNTFLIGGDTMKLSNVWLQGGNRFGTTGKFGTLDDNPIDFYTNNLKRGRWATGSGHLLINTDEDLEFYHLQVNGIGLFHNGANVGTDAYRIALIPNYNYGGYDGPKITFGAVYASIGVNKHDFGNVPEGSLLIGQSSPWRWTATVDYSGNPTFVTDGAGLVTINGGYFGIQNGGSLGVGTDASAPTFKIYGGRGTGAGVPGDINFYTGNAQSSGTTIHSMTTRWIIKGSTGFLSNAANPTSVLDITGANGYSQLRLRTSYTPISTSDTNGNEGDFSWDDSYFYIKTSTGWKRAALTTF